MYNFTLLMRMVFGRAQVLVCVCTYSFIYFIHSTNL